MDEVQTPGSPEQPVLSEELRLRCAVIADLINDLRANAQLSQLAPDRLRDAVEFSFDTLDGIPDEAIHDNGPMSVRQEMKERRMISTGDFALIWKNRAGIPPAAREYADTQAESAAAESRQWAIEQEQRGRSGQPSEAAVREWHELGRLLGCEVS